MDLFINNELCKPIPGYSRYHISISGRLYRTKPISPFEERMLEQSKKNTGQKILYFIEVKSKLQSYQGHVYLRCGIHRDKEPHLTTNGIGYLVTCAFDLLPLNERDSYKLTYKDGNPTNCHVDNLLYIQRQPNNHILRSHDIPKIRKMIREGYTLVEIGRRFKVSEMQIHRIKTGENWSKKRKIFPKKLPFQVEDPKIRRLLTYFKAKKLTDSKIKSPFTIKRDKYCGTNNIIIGRINGYSFKNNHKNISRARDIVDKLNRYFFSESIAERYTEKLQAGMKKDVKNLAHRARQSQ